MARLRLALAGLLLVGCGGVRSMIYPVPAVAVPSPAPPPLQEIRLAGGEGAVSAWLRESAAAGRGPLVLYLHGNAENLETLRHAGLYEDFASLGADVLAVDYPGYGRSAGAPSESANLEAAAAALAWARAERPGQRRVVAGWSLGAAVAVELAASHPEEVDQLVLMSPWSSLRAIARRHYPGFVVAALLRERYDSVAAAGKVRCPTLVLHGAADWIIPPAESEAVAGALGERGRRVLVPNAGHNDLLADPLTWETIREALRARSG